METITLKRDGDLSLTFEGELLGSGSSRRGQITRWFEVCIYRTAAGAFVVAGVGRSIVDGETDRCWAEIVHTGAEVRSLLTRTDNDDIRYITRTAMRAMTEAAEHDERIRDVAAERVA